MIRLGRARVSPLELVVLAAGLLVFSILAWDSPLWDPTQQAELHLIAAGAIALLAVMAWRGATLPRSSLEVPILALLLALALASVTSQNTGLSAGSLAASLVWALMLPIAIVALRRQPTLTALVVIVPVLVIATQTLWVMLVRRLSWLGDVAGLPPIRLPNETTTFGSVAVPPFILLACLGLSSVVPHRRLRLALQAGVILLGAPLALLSGSRSAWLAIGVTVVVMAIPLAGRLRPGVHARPTLRGRASPAAAAAWAGFLALGLLLLVAAAIYVAPRLDAISSLLYREKLWRDTVAAWSANPLLGVGPGVMPFARQAAATAGSFPVHQPHSHDLALGVLGDAGIVGLAAALAVVAVFFRIAGPHRSRTVGGRLAASILIGMAVGGLFEDLTFLPGFDLVLILLVAVALLDADAVRWRPIPPAHRSHADRRTARGAWALAGVGALALLVPVTLTDAAAITYRSASNEAWALQWQAAEASYRSAVTLDPWQPTGPKSLAVAADYAGDAAVALAAARRATELNGGDAQSWANLAILCADARDRSCALHAAGAAVAYAAPGGRELINAALVYERFGEHTLADAAFRESMLTTYDTDFAIDWPRRVDPGTTVASSGNVASGELALLVARRTQGYPIDPGRYRVRSVQALAYAMLGDRSRAQAALSAAEREEASDLLTWDIAVLLGEHWGEDTTHARAMGVLLRGRPLPTAPPSRPRLTWDVTTFRPYPGDGFISRANRLIPRQPWLTEFSGLLPPASGSG